MKPPLPPRPRHVNDCLGKAVVSPPDRESIERALVWQSKTARLRKFQQIITLLDNPKTYC